MIYYICDNGNTSPLNVSSGNMIDSLQDKGIFIIVNEETGEKIDSPEFRDFWKAKFFEKSLTPNAKKPSSLKPDTSVPKTPNAPKPQKQSWIAKIGHKIHSWFKDCPRKHGKCLPKGQADQSAQKQGANSNDKGSVFPPAPSVSEDYKGLLDKAQKYATEGQLQKLYSLEGILKGGEDDQKLREYIGELTAMVKQKYNKETEGKKPTAPHEWLQKHKLASAFGSILFNNNEILNLDDDHADIFERRLKSDFPSDYDFKGNGWTTLNEHDELIQSYVGTPFDTTTDHSYVYSMIDSDIPIEKVPSLVKYRYSNTSINSLDPAGMLDAGEASSVFSDPYGATIAFDKKNGKGANLIELRKLEDFFGINSSKPNGKGK